MLTRVAALVLALVCGGGVVAANAESALSADGAPTYNELPLGAPTTLPWWQGGQLHLGETVIATRRSDIVSRNGTTVVGLDELDFLDHYIAPLKECVAEVVAGSLETRRHGGSTLEAAAAALRADAL